MISNDLIKVNEPAEKLQTSEKIIDKLDNTIAILLNGLEQNLTESNKLPMHIVDAIVKLAKIRPNFILDDPKEIERQVAYEIVKETMKITEEKGVFDELG